MSEQRKAGVNLIGGKGVDAACGLSNWHSPDNLEKRQFEPVASFCSDAEIWKHKKPRIFAAVFSVLEMIQTADDGASGVSRLAVIEQMQLVVGLDPGEGCKHEIVGVLKKVE